MPQKGIVILGMHRSGTSLTAELVHGWGAYTPTEDLLPASPRNPNGFWELRSLVDFNDGLLAAVNSRWFLPPTTPQRHELESLARQPSWRAEALKVLASVHRRDVPWFFKDPRLTIVLPFWEQIWSDVVYVIPVRHPIEVAESLRRRDHTPIVLGALLWEKYVEALLRHLDG